MRIIEQPQIVRTGSGPAKLRIKCDDGNTYTVKELARLKGLSVKGMQQRLRKHGWDHPNILDNIAEPGFKLGGRREGTAEWQALGSQPRA